MHDTIKNAWESELKSTAVRLIRERFGQLPTSISPQDCVALMLQFGAWESQRANAITDAYKALVNSTPLQPQIVSSTDWENLRPDGTRHRNPQGKGE